MGGGGGGGGVVLVNVSYLAQRRSKKSIFNQICFQCTGILKICFQCILKIACLEIIEHIQHQSTILQLGLTVKPQYTPI